MGLNPRTPGSHPEPKADAQPLSHPGAPTSWLLYSSIESPCQENMWVRLTSGHWEPVTTEMVCWGLWPSSPAHLLLAPRAKAPLRAPPPLLSQPEKWLSSSGPTRREAKEKPVAAEICRFDPHPGCRGLLAVPFTALGPPWESHPRSSRSWEPTG